MQKGQVDLIDLRRLHLTQLIEKFVGDVIDLAPNGRSCVPVLIFDSWACPTLHLLNPRLTKGQ